MLHSYVEQPMLNECSLFDDDDDACIQYSSN